MPKTAQESDTQPLVSLIVVNWNRRDLLERCLSSLLRTDYPDFEIIVVDNASRDGSVDFARSLSDVQVVANERNLGFAGGSNVGLRTARGAIRILLNNDIVVPSDWLQPLVNAFVDDLDIAIAGCKILSREERVIQHVGGKLSYPTAFPQHEGCGEEDRGQYSGVRDVEYVTGAVFAIRETVLGEIGYLDERFFPGYFEEVDFCRRARERGHRVVCVSESTVEHLESQTMKSNPRQQRYAFHKNRLAYILKHFEREKIFRDFLLAERHALEVEDVVRELEARERAYAEILEGLPGIVAERRDRAALTNYRNVFEELRDEALLRLYRFDESRSLLELDGLRAKVEASAANLAVNHVVSEPRFAKRRGIRGRLADVWFALSCRPFVRAVLEQQNAINYASTDHLGKASRLTTIVRDLMLEFHRKTEELDALTERVTKLEKQLSLQGKREADERSSDRTERSKLSKIVGNG